MPDIAPEDGPLIWSKVPEFALMYNGYSAVIPYVEYYLNGIMNRVRKEACADQPALAATLATFVEQETQHSQYHVRFNQRLFAEGIDGLQAHVDRLVGDVRTLRRTRPLAWNAAYCAGFESIATFAARYLHEACDAYFEGADPHGANLLLWHVAEEYEHRAVCHDACLVVSRNWFSRMWTLLYAFWHVGSALTIGGNLVVQHYQKGLPPAERKASERRARALFWRQVRYVAPRMLRIFLPWYHPAQLRDCARIDAALAYFGAPGPIRSRFDATARPALP
jgi:predicted metal-dependent hydrolase